MQRFKSNGNRKFPKKFIFFGTRGMYPISARNRIATKECRNQSVCPAIERTQISQTWCFSNVGEYQYNLSFCMIAWWLSIRRTIRGTLLNAGQWLIFYPRNRNKKLIDLPYMSRTDQVNFDVNAKFIFDLFICLPLNGRGSALRFTLTL